MGRPARWGMVTAALVLAVSWNARADEDRANREAEARFKEGLARVKSKDFEAARLSFEQAYAVLHRPLILWNLALSEEKTSRPLDALAHFRQVAREAPSDADRASAQKHVDALLGELSRIDVQAPAGTTFRLDGSSVAGTAPLGDPLDVVPGHHVLAATLAGGLAKSSDVAAVAGEVAHVSFAPDPPAPVVDAATPAAAPVAATAAAPLPDVPPPPDASPKPFWTARTVTATVFAGVAVVAGGAAAAFGLASQNNKSAVDRYKADHTSSSYCLAPPGTVAPSDCTPWNDAVNAQNRDANISNALYFAAGAFALGAVVSWFFWPKESHLKAAWVLPALGAQTAGVEVGGGF